MERNSMAFHLASLFFCRWLLRVQHMRGKHVGKKKTTLQINDRFWKELTVQISGVAGISFQGKYLVMSWLQASAQALFLRDITVDRLTIMPITTTSNKNKTQYLMHLSYCLHILITAPWFWLVFAFWGKLTNCVFCFVFFCFY